MKNDQVRQQQFSSEIKADDDHQMKNLSLSDQSRTQKNQSDDTEVNKRFSFCITI